MMEIAYVCEWEKRPKVNHCPSIPLVCAWSCRNLIAFTTDLKDEEDDKDLSHMIHITDTDHPWDVYSINSGHTEVISCLEWDQSGSRLLSADGEGQIKCWGMTEHLLLPSLFMRCTTEPGRRDKLRTGEIMNIKHTFKTKNHTFQYCTL
uniref:Mediator complex subunit 16 n=1 Tax=Cyprinus carpio TaxID=7962 RepID=A0A8C1STX2_CYPCA